MWGEMNTTETAAVMKKSNPRTLKSSPHQHTRPNTEIDVKDQGWTYFHTIAYQESLHKERDESCCFLQHIQVITVSLCPNTNEILITYFSCSQQESKWLNRNNRHHRFVSVWSYTFAAVTGLSLFIGPLLISRVCQYFIRSLGSRSELVNFLNSS